MKIVLRILAASALLSAFQASAQADTMSETVGTVTFPTSCTASVQHDFEHAVAMLHSFAYAESEQAFRAVIAEDPSCAIAHWGVAMSRYHELWSPPSPDDLRTGSTETEQAEGLNAGTPRERQFIAALAAFYKDWDRLPHKDHARAYSDAMAGVASSNPGDVEAQLFYALSLIAIAPPEDKSHADQKRAIAILEPIFHAYPDHPGAAHYLIHAYDSTELASQGLVAARAYSKIAPSMPHALHMPSHIYTRLGLWRDSIASNLAAREAAKQHADVGEQLHAMDYLTYAYLQRGQWAAAELVVADLGTMKEVSGKDFKIGYAATAMPVRLVMERHKWSDAAKLAAWPGSTPQVAAIVFWARAVADARGGHPQKGDGDIASIESCRAQLQSAGDSYWARQVAVLGKEAKAWQLDAVGRPQDAVQLLQEATDEEDSLEKLPVTPGPVIPAREQLGEMLLVVHRPKDALKEFQAALIEAPGRRGALTGAMQAAELADDKLVAGKMRAQLASE